MTMGVFVQLNAGKVGTGSTRSRELPIGYIVQENGCWDWVGTTGKDGYGQMYSGKRMARSHRVVYERTVGPVPEGKQLDHLCRNRKCVNPDHLEPVDNRTNVLRGVGPTARNARRTHCNDGHKLTPVPHKGESARRGCLICRPIAGPKPTHCREGHPYRVSGRRSRRERVCFECQARKARERYHANKRANANG